MCCCSECISAASNKLEIALQEAELELETFSVKEAWILDAFKFVTTHQSLQIVLDLSDSLSVSLYSMYSLFTLNVSQIPTVRVLYVYV